jgi:hypothetical protein
VDWVNLAQDRDHWRALGNNSDEPSGSGVVVMKSVRQRNQNTNVYK